MRLEPRVVAQDGRPKGVVERGAEVVAGALMSVRRRQHKGLGAKLLVSIPMLAGEHFGDVLVETPADGERVDRDEHESTASGIAKVEGADQ